MQWQMVLCWAFFRPSMVLNRLKRDDLSFVPKVVAAFFATTIAFLLVIFAAPSRRSRAWTSVKFSPVKLLPIEVVVFEAAYEVVEFAFVEAYAGPAV